MKKEIIFFDGDGTLWYPKSTKHKEGAWWVYQLPGGHKEHNKHFTLTPTTFSTLKKLKKKRNYYYNPLHSPSSTERSSNHT